MARQLVAVIGSALASVVLVLVLSSPPAAAQACYPPPCNQPQVTAAGTVTGVEPLLLPAGVPAHSRPAVPLVAAGLLAVAATLTTLCLQRRAMLVVAVRHAPPVGDVDRLHLSARQEHASSLP